MSDHKINSYHNQDKVFKEALDLFLNTSLDFFEIPDQQATEILSTEITETTTKKRFSDKAMKTSLDKGLHFENEVDISKDDIMRFCSYNIDLARKHKIPFTTIIITTKEPSCVGYDEGSIKFTPKIIDLSKRDADKVLENYKNGKNIDDLELIYLPLYHSKTKSTKELYDTAIKLACENENKIKIHSLQILLMSTFMDRSDLLKVLEDNMFELENNPAIEFFVGKGEERGVEKNKREVAISMKNKGYDISEISDILKMSIDWVKNLFDGLQ